MGSFRTRVAAGCCVALLALAAILWAWHARQERGASQIPVAAGLEDASKAALSRSEERHEAVRREIRKNFQTVAEDLDSRAPMAVDDNMTFEGAIVGGGPSMIYRYSLKTPGLKREDAERILAERVCSEPDMRDYMPYGVHYDYVYSCGGEELFRIVLDDAVCSAREAAAKAAGTQGVK